MITDDCNIIEVILSRLEYLKSILQKSKCKTEGICLLIKHVDALKELCIRGVDLIEGMIAFLSGLDAGYEVPEERKNRKAFEQAIVVVLDIMEKLGAKEVPVSKGDKFDPHIHKAVGVEETAELPDQSVIGIVFRGFQIGKSIHYPEVIVAKNSTNAPPQEQGETSVVEERTVRVNAYSEHVDPHRKLCAPRDEYQQSVKEHLRKLTAEQGNTEWIEKHKEELLMVYLLDFDPVTEKLESLYSPHKRGSDPCDPTAILRSIAMMHAFRKTSLTLWANDVKSDPNLAVFCGFAIGKAPSVGSYYNMKKRLEDGPYLPKCRHRIKASERRHAIPPFRMPKTKPKERKKEAPDGVLEKLVEQLVKNEGERCPNDLEHILNEILFKVAVIPSYDKKLIDDISKLTVAADGSTIPSGASKNGKSTCDCRKKGIFRCEHLRKFSDMQANWGWDNRVEDFVFGYRYYQFVCADNAHDLPVYISFSSANTHEAVMSLKALDRMQKMFTHFPDGARIDRLSGDAIHDAYAYYRYLAGHHIRYVIPYAKHPASCLTLGQDSLLFTAEGVPLCAGGLSMRPHGQDRQGRKMYACPAKRATSRDGHQVYVAHREECPLESLCEADSALGPIVHVSREIDPRIHPEIARNSREYRQLAKMRTSAERSNSMKKERFQGKYMKTRVMVYGYIRMALASLLEHSRVWAEKKLKEWLDRGEGILSLFT